MNTITPTHPTTIRINATLTSPFHHGAGSAGNTSLLRTQDVIQPDGTAAQVPFLSGGSIRHQLRAALAWHLAKTIDIEHGSLTKQAVDLLWTGGAVSSTGAKTDLDMIRRVEKHLPMLSMLGYAAKSDIIEGTLRTSDWVLVCDENNHRTTAQSDRRAAAYRSEEFGTRHDQATSPAGLYIDLAHGDETTTTQMIWDTQTLIPGAQLEGTIQLTPAATPMHRTVLDAALQLWAPDGTTHLGAKAAQGYGQATITTTHTPDGLDAWTEHITTHADDIRTLITELGE